MEANGPFGPLFRGSRTEVARRAYQTRFFHRVCGTVLACIVLLALLRSPGTSLMLLAAGGGIVLLLAAGAASRRKGELAPWHTLAIESEYRAGCGDGSFVDYLAREEQVFRELEELLASPPSPDRADAICRFRTGSPADPAGYPTNWNRSFELAPGDGEARCGVLLLHGMSDSPYSLRALGERLRRDGARVLGLRLPGHGTVPAALLELHRNDLTAAARLALGHLGKSVEGRPLFLVGYSAGGALAVDLALDTLEDAALPRISGIALVSPSIGVTPLARLAVWLGRLGRFFGFERLAWVRILPEFDPYKYQSFPINAGHQVYRLAVAMARRLDRLGAAGKLADLPPILAFQSAVDDTVSTPALIQELFARLPRGGHELVLFDINRMGLIESFIAKDPATELAGLLHSLRMPVTLTVLANRDPLSLDVEARRHPAEEGGAETRGTGLAWPPGVHSLSHVALPFSPEDPIYGNAPSPDREGATYQIGNVVLRGERGVLRIPESEQLRLRWNPFYPWLEERVAAFVQCRSHPPRGGGPEGAAD